MDDTNAPVTLTYSKKDGPVTAIMAFRGEYRFLSNFYPGEIDLPAMRVPFRAGPPGGLGFTRFEEVGPMTFPATENAYMAWKIADDPARKLLTSLTPAEAKRYSNTPEFEAMHRADYTDESRAGAMLFVVRQKFAPKRHPHLAEWLVRKTGEATLVEGNSWGDKLFGFCMRTGTGQNYLGRIEMRARDEARPHFGLEPLFPDDYTMAPNDKRRLLPAGVYAVADALGNALERGLA